MKKPYSKITGVLAGTALFTMLMSVVACGSNTTGDIATTGNTEVAPTVSVENNTNTEPAAVVDSNITSTPIPTEAAPEVTPEITPEATPVPSESVPEYKYIMMNIPYADFYRAELSGNSVDVDTVASATLNKTRSGGMMSGGSYHQNSDGSDISGVTFPVAVPSDFDLSSFTKITDENSVSIEVSNRGQTTSTTYTGKEALFESPSYSYYELSEAPEYFKYLTSENGKLAFSKVTNMNTTTLADISGAIQTNTSYGDFQINLADTGIDTLEPTIYGVIIHTKEGVDFGLRHLENIWRYTQFAWCSGFTASVHNCPTSSEHYKDIMGKTITGFTYYTGNGCFEIALKDDAYVPYKFSYTLNVSDSDSKSGSVAIESSGFPEDYKKAYSITDKSGEGVEAFSISNDTIILTDNVLPGAYTLSIADENTVYSDVKTQFTIFSDSVSAAFDSSAFKLSAASDVSPEDFANYLGNITAVTIDDVKYPASGRGAVEIINPEDGTVDFETDPFKTAPKDAAAGYSITVTATGYPDYSFSLIRSTEN